MKFVIFTILFLSLAFSECYRHRLIHHLKYKRHYNSMSLKDFTKLVQTRFKQVTPDQQQINLSKKGEQVQTQVQQKNIQQESKKAKQKNILQESSKEVQSNNESKMNSQKNNQIEQILPKIDVKQVQSQSKQVQSKDQQKIVDSKVEQIKSKDELKQDGPQEFKYESVVNDAQQLQVESKQEDESHPVEVAVETKKVEFKDLIIKKDDKRFAKQEGNQLKSNKIQIKKEVLAKVQSALNKQIQIKIKSPQQETPKKVNIQEEDKQEENKQIVNQKIDDIKFENVEMKKAKIENQIEEVVVPKITSKVESSQGDLSWNQSELEQSGVIADDSQSIQYEEPQIVAHHDNDQDHESSDFLGLNSLFSKAQNFIKHLFGFDQKVIAEQRWKSVKDAKGNQIYYQDNFHYGQEKEVRQAPKQNYIPQNPQARVFLLNPEKKAGSDELVSVFNPIQSKSFTSTIDRAVVPNPTL